MYDVVRIDHFRGFDEYFSIPYGAETAKGGHWEKGPGMDLFNRMKEVLGDRAVIAEDLGYMTDTVKQLVADSGFPGMKVLEFAFDSRDTGNASDYLPHNYDRNCVAYTGTHDNETLTGWFANISEGERNMARTYLNDFHSSDEKIYWNIVNLVMRSHADLCIIPMQDYLGYDNRARMNQPSTVGTNWRWRITEEEMPEKLNKEIRTLTRTFGRLSHQWRAQDGQQPEAEE